MKSVISKYSDLIDWLMLSFSVQLKKNVIKFGTNKESLNWQDFFFNSFKEIFGKRIGYSDSTWIVGYRILLY
jgi:hypothetical protein